MEKEIKTKEKKKLKTKGVKKTKKIKAKEIRLTQKKSWNISKLANIKKDFKLNFWKPWKNRRCHNVWNTDYVKGYFFFFWIKILLQRYQQFCQSYVFG